jgi:hypothetical protein
MKCPKCGHSQSRGEECAECGIVFEKFFALQERRRKKSRENKDSVNVSDADSMGLPDHAAQSSANGFLQVYFWTPYRSPWKPTPKYGVIALSLFFAYLFFLLFREPFYQLYPQTNVMDSTILSMFRRVDLVFHEGGHWIFGIFGSRTLAILGGSLNQLLVPSIVAVAFWHRRDASGTAFGLIWLFINFLEVAIYMADARHPVLPLIGNLDPYGSHDWLNLFNIWDLWSVDTAIAKTTFGMGWMGMTGTALWYAWVGFTNLSEGDDSTARYLNRKKENQKDHRPLEF